MGGNPKIAVTQVPKTRGIFGRTEWFRLSSSIVSDLLKAVSVTLTGPNPKERTD